MLPRKKKSHNLFFVHSPDVKWKKNHNNIPFPPLSGKMSSLLCHDLNDIIISEQSGQGDKSSQAPLNLRRSFVYCFLSTMMGAGDYDFDLYIERAVPEDRLFYLNPGPPLVITELNRTEKARIFFGLDLKILQVDFSKSRVAGSVSESIIAKAKSTFDNLLPCEKFVVDLLFQFFERVSITLPILWVAGIVNDEEFIGGIWVFYNYEDIYELEESEVEQIQFLITRMEYLRSAVDLYKLEKQN